MSSLKSCRTKEPERNYRGTGYSYTTRFGRVCFVDGFEALRWEECDSRCSRGTPGCNYGYSGISDSEYNIVITDI